MKNKIYRIINSPNIRNSFWIILEQLVRMFLAIFIGLISARYLGPKNYGVINYTSAFVAFFNPIATLGMEGVLLKKIIDFPKQEGAYIGGCVVWRLLASLLSIAMIEFFIGILNPNDKLKLWVGLIQGLQLFFSSMLVLDVWFQRYLKSKYVSMGKIIASVTVAVYRVVLLIKEQSVSWFAFSGTLSEIIIAITIIYFYCREKHDSIRFSYLKGKEVLSESYHFILSGLMVSIYSQMDKIMIGYALDDVDVGIYSTACGISDMWLFLPIAFINSFRPMILEYKSNHDEVKFMERLKQLYSGLIWLCLFVSLVICFFAKPIVYILYGEAYGRAAEPLRICVWYELFAVIGTARGIWVLAEKKNRFVKYYLGIGAIVNVVLNFVWIPVFGVNGAAFATLITQITTSIIAPLLFRETRIHTKIVLDAFLLKWK